MINRVHIKGNIVFFGTEKKQYRKLEWLERIAISFLARYIISPIDVIKENRQRGQVFILDKIKNQ